MSDKCSGFNEDAIEVRCHYLLEVMHAAPNSVIFTSSKEHQRERQPYMRYNVCYISPNLPNASIVAIWTTMCNFERELYNLHASPRVKVRTLAFVSRTLTNVIYKSGTGFASVEASTYLRSLFPFQKIKRAT